MTTGNLEPPRAALVVLSGYPGTGKTSFARALCEATGALHVESDAIRLRLFERPRYTPAESARVFAAAEATAAAALNAGRHVVLDATNLDTGDRRRFVRLASRLGARFIAVRLTAPDPVIRARLAGGRESLSEATVGVYEHMLGRARRFTTPALTVDSRYPFAPVLALAAALMVEGEC